MGFRNIPQVFLHRGFVGLCTYLVRAFRFFFNRFLPWKRYLKCSIWDGEYKMWIDLKDNGISRTLAINGKREMQLKAILEEEITPGMCIFDIGANIGYYAVWEAIKVSTEGMVYCIEPCLANIDLLKQNIELNNLQNRVEIFNIGAGEKTGEAELFLSKYSNLHTFIPKQYRCGNKAEMVLNGHSIRIPIISVSEFAKDKRKIDLIRMDVEGFEVEIINGMLDLIDSNPEYSPTVIFETHFPKYDNEHHSMRQALRKMFKRGYRVVTVSSNDERRLDSLKSFGYTPYKVISTSDTHRQGLYRDIKNEDAEKLICDIGGIRDVVLKKVD